MVHPKAVESGLTVQLMPDGCHADALFRVDKMPHGKFLEWQHKSTSTAVDTSSSSNDNVWYRFSACADYENCLIVLSVKAEEEIFWAVRGSEITQRDICIGHATFPLCALGGLFQKFTTLWYSAHLGVSLHALNLLVVLFRGTLDSKSILTLWTP